MRRRNICLFDIDPDNDFMGNDDGTPYVEHFAKAKLAVPGAVSDQRRVVGLIDRLGEDIGKIVVSIDSHSMTHSHHPYIWRDDDDRLPPEHTEISFGDFLERRWDVRREWMRKPAERYLRKLEHNGRKLHVWPVHCPTAGWGQNVYWELKDALNRWEARTLRNVLYKYKGMNMWTDQNGVFEALVPDPDDRSTWFNLELLNYVMDADAVAIVGETTPICVLETLKQMASRLDDSEIGKIHLLTDCMSSIPAVPGGPDFPAISKKLLADMQGLGMTLTTSTEFCA